ncbi:MAG TPA: hypothetical protein VIX89_07455 [Bryobacteraceae bacterium]
MSDTPTKRITKLKAVRPELTSHTIVMPEKDLAAYQRHCKAFFDDCRPKTNMETHLTQTLADLSWRLNRIRVVESNLLTLVFAGPSGSTDPANPQALPAAAMAKAFREQGRALDNVGRYAERLSIRFSQAVKQLHEIQADRLTRERIDQQTLQKHKDAGTLRNPMKRGFVF